MVYKLYVCFNRASRSERESGNKARKERAREILSDLLGRKASEFGSGKADGFDTVIERDLSAIDMDTFIQHMPNLNLECGAESAAILREHRVPERLFAWLEDTECDTPRFEFHKTHTDGRCRTPTPLEARELPPYLYSRNDDVHFLIGPIDIEVATSYWHECDNESKENGLWEMMHTLLIAVTRGVTPVHAD